MGNYQLESLDDGSALQVAAHDIGAGLHPEAPNHESDSLTPPVTS